MRCGFLHAHLTKRWSGLPHYCGNLNQNLLSNVADILILSLIILLNRVNYLLYFTLSNYIALQHRFSIHHMYNLFNCISLQEFALNWTAGRKKTFLWNLIQSRVTWFEILWKITMTAREWVTPSLKAHISLI